MQLVQRRLQDLAQATSSPVSSCGLDLIPTSVCTWRGAVACGAVACGEPIMFKVWPCKLWSNTPCAAGPGGQQCRASHDHAACTACILLHAHGPMHVQRFLSPVMGMQAGRACCRAWPGDLWGRPGPSCTLLLCWPGHELPCGLSLGYIWFFIDVRCDQVSQCLT